MFSIIICTHNPGKANLTRLFNALHAFDINSPVHEVIVVDNNSYPELESRDFVNSFLVKNNHAAVICEKTPGLTSARISGIRSAKHDWLVFFDDDNEPAADYLLQAEKCISANAGVGAWGPGKINVEFAEGKRNKWVIKNKWIFQERTGTASSISADRHWHEDFPNGTGLIIKKEIAAAYRQKVINGTYSMSDRIGKSLVSGGDTQMVFEGLNMGYSTGVNPLIKLNHLISADKINMRYILAQTYMTASCYVKAFNETVDAGSRIGINPASNPDIIKLVYTLFRHSFLKVSPKSFYVVLYRRLGEMNARYLAAGAVQKKKPGLLFFFEKLIHV